MKYARSSEQIVSKLVDGEVIVIDLTTGIYYSLEGTAAKIWRELCAGVESDNLFADAIQVYPENAHVSEQVCEFVAVLVSDGLLREAEAATPTDSLDELAWPAVYDAPERTSFDDVAEMVALDPPLPELQGYSTDR